MNNGKSDSVPDEMYDKALEALEVLSDEKGELHQKVLDQLPNRPRFSRKSLLNQISKSFRDERLVMVLGAGVSYEFGIPTWNALLQKLMIKTIEQGDEGSNLLAQLFTKVFSPSPVIAGRYLYDHYKQFEEDGNFVFEDAVRKVLYENIDFTRESLMMREIVNFCVAPGKSPNLDSIITYNYDDVLETMLSKLEVNVPFKVIYDVGMNPRSGVLPIYHVHGFLPHKGKLKEKNKITLGENIYHQEYGEIYSWSNIVQINKYRDFSCLFIGTSLTDPNLRRLLDIARLQRGGDEVSHHLFRKRYEPALIEKRLLKRLKEDSLFPKSKLPQGLKLREIAKSLIEIIESYEENDALSFGVKTIWIEEFSEITEFLREIRLK